MNAIYTTLGGRVACTQCNVQSKRAKLQCRVPAIEDGDLLEVDGTNGIVRIVETA